MLILLMQNKNKKQKNGVNIPSNDSKSIMHDTTNLPTLINKENGLNSKLLWLPHRFLFWRPKLHIYIAETSNEHSHNRNVRICRVNVVTKSEFTVLPDSKYSLYVAHSVSYMLRNPNIGLPTGRPQRPSNRTWTLIKALTYVGLFVRASTLCVGVGFHVRPTIWIDSLIVNSVFQSLRGWCRQNNISKFSTYNESDESPHSKQQDNGVLIIVDLRQLRKIQRYSSSGKIGRKEVGPHVRKLLTNLTLKFFGVGL